MSNLNTEVTEFLDGLNHPFRNEIERLRFLILDATDGLTENIKWNGPNYCHDENDRITMKIQPPKQIQLIFHRGAKKQEQPGERLIQTDAPFLSWKENDRAIATFKHMADIETGKTALKTIIKAWIAATKNH